MIELKKAFYISAAFALLLWIVKFIELSLNISFSSYGIFPGKLSGLAGIFLAPFLHGDFIHIFSNTIPLVVLGTSMIYLYPASSLIAIPSIYVLGGLGIWFFARPVTHIGASGLVYGFIGFVFFSGIFRRDSRAMALSLIVVFLYGGMIWGVLPMKESVSFESHLSGAVVGIVFAYLLRRIDPPRYREFDDDDFDEITEEEDC